ncbi:MAG: hypothetical protein WBA12_00285 [Catalinimonas sp.]
MQTLITLFRSSDFSFTLKVLMLAALLSLGVWRHQQQADGNVAATPTAERSPQAFSSGFTLSSVADAPQTF